MKKYEIFEHTADVGIIAYGKNLTEAFENAGTGMFSVITDVEKVETIGEYRVVIEASDLEQLLVDWLSELLYIHTVNHVMFTNFKVDIEEIEGKWRLKGNAFGENYDEKKHPYHTEIKAITHHLLEIKKNDVYRIQFLLDI